MFGLTPRTRFSMHRGDSANNEKKNRLQASLDTWRFGEGTKCVNFSAWLLEAR